MLKASLRPSRLLVVMLALGHGAAMAVVVIVSMPLWLVSIAIAASALSLLRTVRRTALLLAPESVVAIEVATDNALSVRTRRGDWMECEVLGSTYVMSFVALLNLKPTGGGATRRIVILPDSIDTEDFRKLRVWLRWKESAQER